MKLQIERGPELVYVAGMMVPYNSSGVLIMVSEQESKLLESQGGNGVLSGKQWT